jgi:hypothetical protein
MFEEAAGVLEMRQAKEALLFVNKKKQKNFVNLARAVSTPMAQRKQKFLRRFFQK